MPDEDSPVLLPLPRSAMRALHRVILMVQGKLDDKALVVSEEQLKLIEERLRAVLQSAADA